MPAQPIAEQGAATLGSAMPAAAARARIVEWARPKKLRFSTEHAYQAAHGHGTVTWLSAFPA